MLAVCTMAEHMVLERTTAMALDSLPWRFRLLDSPPRAGGAVSDSSSSRGRACISGARLDQPCINCPSARLVIGGTDRRGSQRA